MMRMALTLAVCLFGSATIVQEIVERSEILGQAAPPAGGLPCAAQVRWLIPPPVQRPLSCYRVASSIPPVSSLLPWGN
jgi:hypothetical protein